MAGKSAPGLTCLRRVCPHELATPFPSRVRHWLTIVLPDRRLEFSAVGVITTVIAMASVVEYNAIVPAAIAFIRDAVIAATGVVLFVLVVLILTSSSTVHEAQSQLLVHHKARAFGASIGVSSAEHFELKCAASIRLEAQIGRTTAASSLIRLASWLLDSASMQIGEQACLITCGSDTSTFLGARKTSGAVGIDCQLLTQCRARPLLDPAAFDALCAQSARRARRDKGALLGMSMLWARGCGGRMDARWADGCGGRADAGARAC
jgi:hypothetical protein